MVNGKHRDLRRTDVPCPLEWSYIQLAERFGKWPWECEDQPTDKLLFYGALMSKAAEYQGWLAGVEPDEQFLIEEDDL